MDNKRIKGILVIIVSCFLIGGWVLLYDNYNTSVPVINHDQLIRLHVIANSDSVEDQALKLKVRDSIIEYLRPQLSNITDVKEARTIICSKQQEIAEVAKQTIALEGKHYPLEVKIGFYTFPIKTYGNIVLPAGEYEAVKVLIGEAQGKNWWCVLFPPLCFVDVTNACASGNDYKIQDDNEIHIKWKIAEMLGK